MHILVVMDQSSWVEYHLVGSLREMGHKVHTFTYGAYVGEFYGRSRAAERQKKNHDLLAYAGGLRNGDGLDLIFCYVYDDFLMPDTAKALQLLDVPMVNFNVDMSNQWYRQIRTAPYFTRMLCAQKVNMRNMERAGAKVLYFPMAARPTVLERGPDISWQPEAPVTFMGTPMVYRHRILNLVHKAGLPLAVYGKQWQQNQQATPDYGMEKTLQDIFHYAVPRIQAEGTGALIQALKARVAHFAADSGSKMAEVVPMELLHGYLPNELIPHLFQKSAINLDFTRMQGDDPEVPGTNQVKLRDFEVPMAGGFYLVESASDYSELFEPGKEVETWSRPAELLDKIRYYLDHDSEREAIAAAGARRATKAHTWSLRFSGLFAELGLPC